MASNFTVLSSKYYDQIINGETFSSNLGDFNGVLTGNTGDQIKLIQQIQLAVSYNLSESLTITFNELAFNPSVSSFTSSTDWFTEGFYPGASILVERGDNSETITIVGISNVGNSELTFSKADATLLNAFLPYDEDFTNVTVKLLSVPTYATYKYGLNPVGFVGESYQSPLDSNIQAYYAKAIPTSPSFETMAFVGGQNGASLGSAEIAYVGTVDSYRHTLEIRHTFKIPYYVAGQISNLEGPVNPDNLTGTNTFRYDNRFEVGTPTYQNSVFFNPGTVGNVGYFNENFNGLENPYSIDNLVITNASGSGKLESTETNTVEFDVITTGTWNLSIAGIIGHSKLPTSTEYQNKTTAYNTIWIFETLRNTESAATVSGTIITNFEFSIDTPTVINVSFDLAFNASQQALISETSNYLLWFTIANNDLTDPELIDRVNLVVDVNSYSKNTDVSGLVTNYESRYYPSWQAYSGQGPFSKFSGGDGDIWAVDHQVTLDTTREAQIKGLNFKILADNGTDTFELRNYYIPVFGALFTTDGTYIYQILNIDIQNNLNLPADDLLNRITIELNAPGSPSTTQVATIRLGFQVPWRDWIENLNVPASFYDDTEPQNNRNEKTSNYSGTGSPAYSIYGVLEAEISNNIEDANTFYNLYSEASTILDFDAAGWIGFSGSPRYYDSDGVEVFSLEDGRDIQIHYEFDHLLGVLNPANLEGFMWIEINGTTLNPSYLSTIRDWTDPTNILKPTDTLLTGNVQYVEIVSVSNKVTFICQTNSENMTAGFDYKPKGRLWKRP